MQLAPTARDRSVHERHAVTVAERDLPAGSHVGRLRRGDALTGQRGFFDLERGGDEEPTVGRDAVARFDQHDVARYQLARVDLHRVAVAAHAGDVLHHVLQRGQARLRLGLLVHAQYRVEDRQPEQHERRADLLGEDLVDDRGAEQNQLHDVAVLT